MTDYIISWLIMTYNDSTWDIMTLHDTSWFIIAPPDLIRRILTYKETLWLKTCLKPECQSDRVTEWLTESVTSLGQEMLAPLKMWKVSCSWHFANVILEIPSYKYSGLSLTPFISGNKPTKVYMSHNIISDLLWLSSCDKGAMFKTRTV